MVEKGILRRNVDLAEFSVGGNEYQRNGVFVGKLDELPHLWQDEADLDMANWGCGVFASRLVLALFGRKISTFDLRERAYGFGLSGDGFDEEMITKMLLSFGLVAIVRQINSLVDIQKITSRGSVVMTTVVEHDWRKLHRSSLQTYENHWVVIPSADSRSVLIADSELRDEVVGGSAYGVYSMPWASFVKRNYCYWVKREGEVESVSGDFIWGESYWNNNDVLEVFDPTRINLI